MTMTRTSTTAPDSLPDQPPMGRLPGLEHLCGEQPAIAERAAQWCSSFKPCNAWEDWLVDRIAVESLRVERCTLQEMAMRAHLGERAKVLWDADRAVAALELARGIAKAPELTRAKLELSSPGCDWLVDRWRMLLAVAEGGSRWDEAQRSLAFDLLGRAPEARSVDAAVHGDPAGQARLARGEIARLADRRANLLAGVEAAQRAMAEAGVGPEVEAQLKALRRYEAQCLRRLEWAFAQFKKGRHDYRPGQAREFGSRAAAGSAPAGSAGAGLRPNRTNPTGPAPRAGETLSAGVSSVGWGGPGVSDRASAPWDGRPTGPGGA